MASFSLIIVTYVHLLINCIYRYYQFILHHVTYIHVYNIKYLVLDHQLMCSSSRKIISPALSRPLCAGVKFCGLLHPTTIHLACWLLPLFSSHLHSQVVANLWVKILTLIKNTILLKKLPDPLAFMNLPLPFLQCSLSFRLRSCFLDVSILTGLHSSVFWLVVAYSICFCQLQREVSLMKEWRPHFPSGMRTNIYSVAIYYAGLVKWCFVGFPPRSVTSVALGCSLGFCYQSWFPSFWAGLMSN